MLYMSFAASLHLGSALHSPNLILEQDGLPLCPYKSETAAWARTDRKAPRWCVPESLQHVMSTCLYLIVGTSFDSPVLPIRVASEVQFNERFQR